MSFDLSLIGGGTVNSGMHGCMISLSIVVHVFCQFHTSDEPKAGIADERFGNKTHSE